MTPEDTQVIQALIDEGDNFLNADDFDSALRLYQQAASMIPNPVFQYAIALTVFLAIGEALFYSKRYNDALRAFHNALKAPGGVENPLVYLRLGQSYFEQGDLDRAAEELMRAYMLEGEEIFEGDEEKKYLAFLKTRMSS